MLDGTAKDDVPIVAAVDLSSWSNELQELDVNQLPRRACGTRSGAWDHAAQVQPSQSAEEMSISGSSW